jgi:uncharacterized damage-inducible protein DinB
MLVLLTSLTHHQAWADAALLTAVHSHPESLRDEQLRNTLHHIVTAQRLTLARILNRPFDREKEIQPPETFEQQVQLYRTTHEEQLALLTSLTAAGLEPRISSYDSTCRRSNPTPPLPKD